MVGARGPQYSSLFTISDSQQKINNERVPGNVISATVGLVYINLQPEYELPTSTRFG